MTTTDKAIQEWLDEVGLLTDRQKTLRRLALYDLYYGNMEGQEGCESYPGFTAACAELATVDVPTLYYEDWAGQCSDVKPRADACHVCDGTGGLPPIHDVDACAIVDCDDCDDRTCDTCDGTGHGPEPEYTTIDLRYMRQALFGELANYL